jgi:5-(carboxyamino)imidazole ribonucleotide synthase
MIAQAAKDLRLSTAALDTAADSPALQVVDKPVVGPVDDIDSALKLARISDVVTLEWELIPTRVLEAVAREKPLYPAPSVLAIIQDRLTQKEFLQKHNFPQTRFGQAQTASDLPHYPIIVKRRTHGYDGKGQARLTSAAAAQANAEIFKAPCVWEEIVPFDKEVSVILARDRKGRTSVYPVAENSHRNGILHATRAPALIPETVERQAIELALAIAEKLGHVGVMAVEMFLLPNHQLLVNEIAPRVHNSGHYTLGACATSQFEQHARAVCGWPLGPITMKGPATMVNLLGDVWENGEPRWPVLDGILGLQLHLYGKPHARPGRKMAHYTVVGKNAASEWERSDQRLAQLAGK